MSTNPPREGSAAEISFFASDLLSCGSNDDSLSIRKSTAADIEKKRLYIQKRLGREVLQVVHNTSHHTYIHKIQIANQALHLQKCSRCNPGGDTGHRHTQLPTIDKEMSGRVGSYRHQTWYQKASKSEGGSYSRRLNVPNSLRRPGIDSTLQ